MKTGENGHFEFLGQKVKILAYKCLIKLRRLRCCLRLLDIVNFWNFSTLGPYNSETGGRTTKKILLNLLRVVKNVLEQKLFCFIFFTTRHKILPFGKKLPRPKIFTHIFFLVQTPLYQNLKSKLGDILLHTGVTPATGLYVYPQVNVKMMIRITICVENKVLLSQFR